MAERRRTRLTEPVPPYGVALPEADGVARIVANNPGPMTYHGTNTWLVEHGADRRLLVLDPGPDDAEHLRALLDHAAGRIDAIVVSHAHADHAGAAAALAAAADLPIAGHETLFATVPIPVRHTLLADGDRIGGLRVVHTPGHAAEHVCLAREADGILFTADHVMGWSTSVVPPPPWGDAGDYVRSLRLLQTRGDRLLLPAHGPAVPHPAEMLAALLAGRGRREREVEAALRAAGAVATVDQLLPRLYPRLGAGLARAARSNILGYLHKLAADGRARRDGERWTAIDDPTHEGPPAAVEGPSDPRR